MYEKEIDKIKDEFVDLVIDLKELAKKAEDTWKNWDELLENEEAPWAKL